MNKKTTPKISFLITAFDEAKTIANCLDTLISPKFVEGKYDFEILLACPDKETHETAKKALKKRGLENKLIHVKDQKKGKPMALNLLFHKASGDYWILTDGDTYFDKNASTNLIKKISKKNLDLVSGRPISADKKDNFWGYIGHLLANAAHQRRSEGSFFPASGYLMAIKARQLRLPSKCLSDDAYISYNIYNSKGKVGYSPESKVYIKYANNLKDFLIQKKRSVGGFVQLLEYPEIQVKKKPTRSIWIEISYVFFPIKYAQNLQQLIWSLGLYPLRLYMWVLIFWERKILQKSFTKTWQRVESTK